MKYIFLFTALLPIIGSAQNNDQPMHEKKIYVDSAGRYFQQASLPVYLFVGNAPDGKVVPLHSTTKEAIVLEGDGEHVIKHANMSNNKNDEFTIYADGIAPLTKASFNTAVAYASKGVQYYGPGLSVTMTSSDARSGVEQIYYALNDQAYEKYNPQNYGQQGEYVLHFYAVDRTGNAEEAKTKSFVVDVTPPESFHNFVSISSQNVISTNSSIYLSVNDPVSGIKKTFFRFDDEEYRDYTGGNIAFQYLPDGNHTITYYSEDNVANKEPEKSFTFYLDKTAPILSADVLGDKFLVGNRVYFSGRTKLKLTAVDNKSGIKEIMYTINDTPEVQYTDPFYLPNKSGIHSVNFRALDNTANDTKADFQHSVGVIYVDLTGPALSHSFVGLTFNKADTVYISPKTSIKIEGNDPEAGLKSLAYSFDQSGTELPYEQPLITSRSGLYKLSYFGYDNVNNKNALETIFMMDDKGPEITHQFATPANGEGNYPSYVTIYLAAEDKEVGTKEIRYSINGGKEQLYVAPLKGFSKSSDYVIKVIASDFLNNTNQTEIKFKTDKY